MARPGDHQLLVGGAYVLGMDSPVNKQKRCLHPVVRERQALVNQLQSLLRDLGLDRKAAPTETLAEYLARREREQAALSGRRDPAP
ncbi:MAG: hypothetical protein U0807_03445 [Candidatus Binatia bacterium]